VNKIVVVDDDRAIQHLLDSALTSEGFSVRCADHGLAALELFESAEPDLVILDLEMPVLDGRALLREMARRGISIPVLILSAAGARAASREFGVPWLAKPFDIDRLFDEVARLIDGREGDAHHGH
jgi:DNA-binding response OmpR family regulator